MTSDSLPSAPQPVPPAELPYLNLPHVEVREPAHRVSPKAVHYWRFWSLFLTVPVWAAAIAGWFLLDEHPWWVIALTAVAVIATSTWSIVMPPLTYRVRRWEVTPTAIHTRTGWIGQHHTLVPLSRVQTVDYSQGVVQRALGLAEVNATTASVTGSVGISGLPEAEAKQLRAQLARVAEETEDDAT